jgi:hypothetical protein
VNHSRNLPAPTYSVNAVLRYSDHELLDTLSIQLGVSKSKVVRLLLSYVDGPRYDTFVLWSRSNIVQAITIKHNRVNVEALVAFVAAHPGCDKAAIRKRFKQLDERELNLLVPQAMRHGLIENHGSRSYPQWYVTT